MKIQILEKRMFPIMMGRIQQECPGRYLLSSEGKGGYLTLEKAVKRDNSFLFRRSKRRRTRSDSLCAVRNYNGTDSI